MSLFCIQAANGNIDEQHNRVVSEPKPHNGRVTLLSMSRWVPELLSCHRLMSFRGSFMHGPFHQGVSQELFGIEKGFLASTHQIGMCMAGVLPSCHVCAVTHPDVLRMISPMCP